MEEEYGILVIHTDKETGKYKRFEIYPRKVENDLPTQVEKWNKNPEMKTLVKVYDDPLIACLAEDIERSRSNNNLISALSSIAKDISQAAESLDDWYCEITDRLDEIKNEKE